MVYKNHMKKGLIPNFLSNTNGKSAYNTVDATLWYINSILQYAKYTGNFNWIHNEIWPSLKESVNHHINGTSYDIRLDADGLLMHGPQLTWMDARVEDQPVTPRTGKAVEIQALWYNALRIMQTLAGKFNEKNEEIKYAQIAEKTREHFTEKFWNSEDGYLFDTIGKQKDNSLRPNQIVAVSLDFTMLDKGKNERIVDVVHKRLLTPYGIRTLSKDNPLYKDHYFGDRRTRDEAYHNGTVWPWLLGPFTTAYLKTKGYSDFRREYALQNFLLPLMQSQVTNFGLGTINEVFDGEPPYQPRGAIAQAWSIAEPLRAYVEDILQTRPKFEKNLQATK
jgi:predicted glycogen debranching enzyme